MVTTPHILGNQTISVIFNRQEFDVSPASSGRLGAQGYSPFSIHEHAREPVKDWVWDPYCGYSPFRMINTPSPVETTGLPPAPAAYGNRHNFKVLRRLSTRLRGIMAWGVQFSGKTYSYRVDGTRGVWGVNQKDCVWIDTSTFQVMAVLIPKSTDSDKTSNKVRYLLRGLDLCCYKGGGYSEILVQSAAWTAENHIQLTSPIKIPYNTVVQFPSGTMFTSYEKLRSARQIRRSLETLQLRMAERVRGRQAGRVRNGLLI